MKFILAIFLISSLAHAGIRDVGNGGRGVLIDDKPYLLDLYEAGVLAPEIDFNLKSFDPYTAALNDFTILNTAEKEILVKKLTEIRLYSPIIADQLVAGLHMYVWKVLDQKLVEIPEQSPIISPYKQVQLANRLDFAIRLNKFYWDRLDSVNKVALVLHEIFYAYAPTIVVAPGVEEQQSFSARSLVGYVFSPDMKLRGRKGFQSVSDVPWAPSRVLVDNNLELLKSTLEFEVDHVTYGVIGSEDETQSICSQAERALGKRGRDTVKITLSYATVFVSVSFVDYLSPTGQQKRLEMEESMGTYKLYPVTTMDLTRATAGKCASWMKNQVRSLLSVEEFPRLP